MNQNIIEIRNVSKAFEDGQLVLKGIDLNIKKNEFMTILGPSGCGKTTTLRILAGFEKATSGDIFFHGKDLSAIPIHKRNVNTVFQNYALFPHMNVAKNIAFGLQIKKVPANIIKEKVTKMLALVNLTGFENRSVKSLSGGQQQRVAIARALVNEPEILLLDEPLGALDLKLRKEMQAELKNMQRTLGITFVFVTHDQEEALTMSDTIVVMNEGNILQQGTPEHIYNEPATSFVADFIGVSNILPAEMVEDYQVSFAGATFPCVDKKPQTAPRVEVVVRPEDIEITTPTNSDVKGEVAEVVFLGGHYEMRMNINGYMWKVHSTKGYQVGEQVGLLFAPEAIHVMEASGGAL